MRSSDIEKMEKGGAGSGVKGHRTFHENERDRHYEESLKIHETLGKINEMVKQRKSVNPKYQIPEEAKEIIKELKGRLDGHKVSLAGHVNQVGRMDQADAKKVKKAIVDVSNNQGVAVDTGAYSLAEGASKDWAEYFHNCMMDFNYGDAPRDILLDAGYYVTLAKTDDGIYSGRVRQTVQPGQNEPLEENVFKIEKLTIPDMVQVLKAKEYIRPQIVQEPQPVVEVVTHPTEFEMLQADLKFQLEMAEEKARRDLLMKLDIIRMLVNS